MTPRNRPHSRKPSELETLRKIVMAINSHLDDLDRVFNLILGRACEWVGASHGSLMLHQPETHTLRIAAVVGADWTPEKRACVLPVGEGITGRVVATREPYLCPNTRDDSHYRELFPNVASELAVPVISQGRVLGVIQVDSERLDAFTSAHATVLATIAEHAAIAIENARQFAFFKASRERWIQIFDALPDAILIADGELNIERVNARFFEYFEMSPDQVLGHNLFQVLGLIGGFGPTPEIEERLRRGESLDRVFRELASQKEYRWRGLRLSPGDKPLYLISIEARDCGC